MPLILHKILPLLVMPLFLVLSAMAIAILSRHRFESLGNFLLIGAFLTLLIFSLPITSQTLLGSLEARYPSLSVANTPEADAIVLLAGGISPPSEPRKHAELSVASDRVLLAFRLWKAKKAPTIIISGSSVSASNTVQSEAVYTAGILELWGVPRSDIIIEEKSKNTADHPKYLEAIFNDLNTEEFLLITSALHMPRAVMLFKTQDRVFVPTPANRWIVDTDETIGNKYLPSSVSLYGSSTAIREYLGLTYYHLKSMNTN